MDEGDQSMEVMILFVIFHKRETPKIRRGRFYALIIPIRLLLIGCQLVRPWVLPY